MADTKISALTAATTLADTDELVLAVAGASKKITGANLKASMPSGGITELSYVTFTSGVTINATSEAAANTIVTAAAFTAAGSTKYCVECYAPGVYHGSNSPATVRHVLYEGSTVIGQIGLQGGFTAAMSIEVPIYMRVYVTPSAGSRTYSWRAFRLNIDGGVEVGAGGTGTLMPGYIRITSGG